MGRVRRLEQLLDGAVAGQEEAWHELVERFAPLVWSVPRGSGLGSDTSADVAHTSWLRLVERLGAVTPGDVGATLAGEARRETVRALRWSSELDDTGTSPGPLAAALALLPARSRFALRVASAGADGAALAAALAAPEPQAVQLLSDALARLRAERSELAGLDRDTLLARLGAVVGDAPTPTVLASARAAYSWRTLEAELLPTPRDPLEDALTLRGGDSRLETWRGDGVLVELELTPDGDERAVLGRVEPARAQVTLLRPDGTRTDLPLDPLGRLLADGLAPGPVTLRVTDGARVLRTGWLVL